jgi:hypothetical protein
MKRCARPTRAARQPWGEPPLSFLRSVTRADAAASIPFWIAGGAAVDAAAGGPTAAPRTPAPSTQTDGEAEAASSSLSSPCSPGVTKFGGSRRSADATREEVAAKVGGAMWKRKWCVVCLLSYFTR